MLQAKIVYPWHLVGCPGGTEGSTSQLGAGCHVYSHLAQHPRVGLMIDLRAIHRSAQPRRTTGVRAGR